MEAATTGGGVTVSRNPMDRVRVVFAWVALSMWAVSWALDAIAQSTGRSYTIPSSIPTIAIGTAVFLFGASKFTKGGGDK